MKITLLLITSALAITSPAQQRITGLLPGTPHIYYYPFYNGLQMIEVDLLTPAINNWGYYAQTMSQAPPYPSFANPIIIRNRQGQILHQYNTDVVYKAADFADTETPVALFPSPQRAAQLLANNPDTLVQTANGALMMTLPLGRYTRQRYRQRFESLDFYSGIAAIPPEGYQYYARTKNQDRHTGPFVPAKPAPADRLVVYEHGKYGVIDTMGQIIVPPAYDDIDYLPHALLVTKNKHMGLLTPEGRERITPRFAWLYPLGDSLLVAGGNRCGIVNYDGHVVVDSVYDELLPAGNFLFYRRASAVDTFAGGGRYRIYGIMNTHLEEVTKPRYVDFRSYAGHPERPGYFFANNGVAWGILDSLGREISPFYFASSYTHINFKNGIGIAEVIDTAVTGYSTCRIFIDSNFRPLGDGRFGKIWLLCKGYYSVCKKEISGGRGDVYALANSKGEVLTPFQYQQITCMQNGYFDAVTGGRHGVLNRHGEQVLPAVYDYLALGRTADTIKACMYPDPPAVKGEKPPPPVCKIFVAKPTGLVELR